MVPKVRNIHSEALFVSLLDRIVEPDEVIEVPDLVPHETGEFTDKGNPATRKPDLGEVWPASLWAEVASTSKKKGDQS
jgi:hypothetical protein